MIHALIDSVTTRNILGYEVGTRIDFDTRYAGNPLWVFLDADVIHARVNTATFLTTPKLFHITSEGIPRKGFIAP